MRDVALLLITVEIINYVEPDISKDMLLLAVAAIFKHLNFIFEERYKDRQRAIEKEDQESKQHEILIP